MRGRHQILVICRPSTLVTPDQKQFDEAGALEWLNRVPLYTGMNSTWVPAAWASARKSPGSGGEDVVAISGQAHHGGIDRIGQTAASQQHARPPPQAIIQRSDVHPGQQPGHWRLKLPPRSRAAPQIRGAMTP